MSGQRTDIRTWRNRFAPEATWLPTIKMGKRITFSIVASIAASTALGQGDGVSGIYQATAVISSYFEPATRLMYAIAAVIGLIGGIRVYSKFSSGEHDTAKTAAAWFGACLFLIVSVIMLRAFFL